MAGQMKQKPKAEPAVAEMLPHSGISPVENPSSLSLISPSQAALKCCSVLMVSVTYHGAAEGPEPPEQSQSQQEEEDQQGDGQDGPVGLEENTERCDTCDTWDTELSSHTSPLHPQLCPKGPSPLTAT